MDKMIDIFGQRHGRKNFFFQYVLDNIETVDIEFSMQTFNWAVFQMIAVSLDGKMVNVCVCIPISTLTLSGIA